MQQLTFNKEKIQFPTLVSELSLQQFFDLRNPGNDMIDEFCAVSGVDRMTVMNFKDFKSMRAVQTLLNVLAVELNRGFDGITLPRYINLGEKKIKIPADLRLEPIGAFMSVHDLLAEQVNALTKEGIKDLDFTNQIPKTLAHYFFRPYHGDSVLYSDEAAEHEDFMKLIMQIPVTQAVPIANFFFRKFPNLT